MRRSARWFLAIIVAASLLYAQTFEAVSIRPNRSGAPGSETNTTIGRLSLINVTTFSLVLRAFGVQQQQIIGSPGWLASERFDVVAVTGGADRLTDKERRPFIQALLEDRFAFKFHREKRELTAYSLVVSRNGPKFIAHTGPGEYSMKVEGAADRRILRSTKGNFARFVEILSGATGRMVTDGTGLAGEYDFTLEWAPDQDADSVGPSLTTALQEQLGLRLEPRKQVVEVIVIDHIERPSDN